MDWTGVAALVSSLAACAVAAWGALRKERREDTKQEREGSVDDDERWKAFAKERQKQHNADVARLEKKIDQQAADLEALRKNETQCRVEMAATKAENAALKTEVDELRAEIAGLKKDLAECGIRPGTHERKPLQ